MPSGFSDFLGFLRSEHLPSSGTPLGHSVPSVFNMMNVSATWARRSRSDPSSVSK